MKNDSRKCMSIYVFEFWTRSLHSVHRNIIGKGRNPFPIVDAIVAFSSQKCHWQSQKFNSNSRRERKKENKKLNLKKNLQEYFNAFLSHITKIIFGGFQLWSYRWVKQYFCNEFSPNSLCHILGFYSLLI